MGATEGDPGVAVLVPIADSTAETTRSRTARDDEAQRNALCLQAGAIYSQRLPWPALRMSHSQLQSFKWQVVTLDGMTIDLEVRALLRPRQSDSSTNEIILQRHARGETFAGQFVPTRDRRTIDINASDDSVDARQEVVELVF